MFQAVPNPIAVQLAQALRDDESFPKHTARYLSVFSRILMNLGDAEVRLKRLSLPC